MSIVPANRKIPAGLLAIFFGGLGIHKFFLGMNRAGVVMLVLYIVGLATTCIGVGGLILGALHLIGFVEGIIYLVKSDSDFYRDYVVRRQEWF